MSGDNTTSPFEKVPQGTPDAIFGIQQLYTKALKAYKELPLDAPEHDPSKEPISLVIGAYRTEEGKPWVLPVVADVEKDMANEVQEHEYLPMAGLPEFNKEAQKLLFGANHDNIGTAQALSGTGALAIGFLLLLKDDFKTIRLSDPTWANHYNVAKQVGLGAEAYPYYDRDHNCVKFEAMCDAIRKAPEGSAFVLHPSAHNPTGMDLTNEQWQELGHIFAHRASQNVIPFFDCAYQGYASGDIDADAHAVRLFYDMGLHFMVAQSFSKNLGLYGERIGALHIVCQDVAEKERVMSFVCNLIRAQYSNPPAHGARVVARVLGNPERFGQWKDQLAIMTDRLKRMRQRLREVLEEIHAPGQWDHLTAQQGMFSFTGLTAPQVDYMAKHSHIFLLKSGRVSIAGLREANIVRVARAMKEAMENAAPVEAPKPVVEAPKPVVVEASAEHKCACEHKTCEHKTCEHKACEHKTCACHKTVEKKN